MDKISPIKEKILQFIEYKGITKAEFCERTGISYANMKGKGLESEIGGGQIFKILSLFPEISADWLLRGEGEMLRGQEPQPQTQQPATPPTQDERIAELKLIIDDLRYTIGMQKELIASLKAKTGEA